MTFVPLMFFLYFFLSILEESGYMTRVAFLMDKIMRKLGLNGKAFVPMVLGFGCTVPAIYATRTLEDEKSRKLTAALAPFMSCGLGLNGKAFVPMVLGFGCTVPAIYATRTLEDEKSRKLTAALAPFMSCGARLPVYGLFTAAFFGAKAGFVVMSLYLFGIVAAIILGVILKRFEYFKVDNKALLIELP